MKKHVSRLILALAVMLSFSFAASAQVYVKVRPTHEVIVRSHAPSPRHVWVDEEWEGRNGRYEYVQGHWAVPSHGYHVWVRGHWANHRRGYYWVPGHWRR
jgi:hypothetical protein